MNKFLEFNETPEQHWNKIKVKIFPSGVPSEIENLMQKGFNESETYGEKWAKLGIFLIMLKDRFL